MCLWCVRTQSHTHIYNLYYHFWQRIVFVIIIAIKIYEKIIQDLAKYKQHVWEIWAVLASPMLLLYLFLTCLPLARSPPKSSKNETLFSSEKTRIPGVHILTHHWGSSNCCWNQFLHLWLTSANSLGRCWSNPSFIFLAEYLNQLKSLCLPLLLLKFQTSLKLFYFSSWILNRNFWDSHGQLLTQRASCILRSGGPATSFGKCDHFQVSKDFSMDIWDADAADGDGTWWYPAGTLQDEDQAFCSEKKTYAENEKRWPPYVLLVYNPHQL